MSLRTHQARRDPALDDTLAAAAVPVATYTRYGDALAAVDRLAWNEFPVHHLTIVGCELRLVEQVLGRPSGVRASVAGAGTGAWFGLLFGLLVALFTNTPIAALGVLAWSVFLGALFGLLFGVVAQAVTGARRDFITREAIVPRSFQLFANPEVADRARSELGGAHVDGGPR